MTRFPEPPRRGRSTGARRGDPRFPPAAVVGAAVVVTIVVIGLAVSSGGGSDQAVRQRPTSSTTRPTPTARRYPTAVPVPILPGPVAPVISKITTANRVMFFTIDDGLVRDPAAVEFIRANHIPVTLFVLPVPVQQDPLYFQSLTQAGASVQDHTVHHLPMNGLSSDRQVQEICGSIDFLQTTFGHRPWLFRPPFGNYNTATKYAVRQCGLQAIVTWQGTMNDGVLRLQHPGAIEAGDIILMHFRTDLRQNLEVLLRTAKAAGLIPAPLEQYLVAPGTP